MFPQLIPFNNIILNNLLHYFRSISMFKIVDLLLILEVDKM